MISTLIVFTVSVNYLTKYSPLYINICVINNETWKYPFIFKFFRLAFSSSLIVLLDFIIFGVIIYISFDFYIYEFLTNLILINYFSTIKLISLSIALPLGQLMPYSLGKNNIKNVFYYIKLFLVISTIVSTVIIVINIMISRLFTDIYMKDNVVEKSIIFILKPYCFVSFFEFGLSLFQTIIRSINKQNYITLFTSITNVTSIILINYFFSSGYIMDWLIYFFNLIVIFIIHLIYFNTIKWQDELNMFRKLTKEN